MNVALVFPRYKYPSGDAPLGILYIASTIREWSETNINFIDTTFNPSAKYLETALKKRYDIVGISAMTTMINDAIKVAAVAKRHNPDTKVVIGGPHATVLPEETLSNPNFDAVVVGEGEMTFLDIIKNGGNFEGIKGVVYRDRKKIVSNKPRDPIGNLDTIPFPAIDLIDVEKYTRNWFQLDSVSPNLRGMNIIASRGCPYKCSFCQPTLKRMFGEVVRRRSADNIISEIQHLHDKFRLSAFMFQDDTFIVDMKWVFEICDKIIAEKLDLIWGCNVRVNLLSRDLLIKMRSAGLRKINFGIESGSQRILDTVYNKGITLQQVKDAARTSRELGIRSQGYFMLGAPTETREEIEQTIRLAKGLDIDEATFSITTPLPRTYLYDQIKHLITKDFSEFDYYRTAVFKNPSGVTQEELSKYKRKAFLRFYLAPKRIMRTIKMVLSPTGVSKSLKKLKRL